MADRTSFLDRVRSAGRLAELPQALPTAPIVAAPDMTSVDLMDHFVAQLEAVDGIAHIAVSEEVAAVVGGLLDQYGGGDVLMWDDEALPVQGVQEVVEAAGCTMIDHSTPVVDHHKHNATYADANIGITGAEAAFAESGSIVVSSGPGRPRMASLIPLVHIALLPASRIHRSLTHFMTAAPESIDGAANVVAITGPSRTGDIEQELNLGVHGPKHLHVVLIRSL